MGRRLLRAGKWTLFLVGAALALSPFAFIVLARRAEARLERALRELAAAGAPLKAGDLVKPPIPGKENAAVVYRQAFDALSLSSEDQKFIQEVYLGTSSLAAPAVAARAQEILNQNGRALQLIRRASTMARCSFPRDWRKGLETLFPEYAKLRSCSRLLALDSLMALHDERADEALATCGTMLRVADAAEEPTLIGQLARYAIIGITSRSLGVILEQGRPSEKGCRSLADQIRGIELTPAFITALQGERAMGLSMFEQLRSSPSPVWEVGAVAGMDSGQAAPRASEESRELRKHVGLVRWWLASEALSYVRLMGRVIAEARLPHREARRIRPSLEEEVNSLRYRVPPRVLTATMVPVFTKTRQRRDHASATLGVDQIALLLKAYRARRGEYPDSLAPLADSARRPLPVDPFSGKPFRYERRGAGFIVYSVGLNLKDDGGSPRPAACEPPKHPPKEPVVIEQAAKPPPLPDDIVIECSR